MASEIHQERGEIATVCYEQRVNDANDPIRASSPHARASSRNSAASNNNDTKWKSRRLCAQAVRCIFFVLFFASLSDQFSRSKSTRFRPWGCDMMPRCAPRTMELIPTVLPPFLFRNGSKF
ncbi:hypothetical protein KY284_015996 [Solanum tuberosum]|nr:hypothetical protein KY284_015996 [Solanum tuberosum]